MKLETTPEQETKYNHVIRMTQEEYDGFLSLFQRAVKLTYPDIKSPDMISISWIQIGGAPIRGGPVALNFTVKVE